MYPTPLESRARSEVEYRGLGSGSTLRSQRPHVNDDHRFTIDC